MTWAYRKLLRPLLFRQDSESIHNRTLKRLEWASEHTWACQAMAALLRPADLPVDLWGLRFPNPVGLAAGMDKEAAAVPAWAAMGFGFSELGGVTWLPQPGNPLPRVFRAIPEEALVNRMGFNNSGAEAMAKRLAQWRSQGRWPHHPVGINLGKSKLTPLHEAAQDYAKSLQVLWPHVDFFVVNVSSPNTPNLRQLQDKAALDEILAALQNINFAQSAAAGRTPKPILVKVAPDLSFTALDEILELVGPRQVAGLVATNTTITRPIAKTTSVEKVYAETGGLSGRPLASRSTEVIRHIFTQTQGKLPIIGVGGIFSVEDAWEKIIAGAVLVQVYTGLVYEGPGVVKKIVSGLKRRLEQANLSNVSAAVGGFKTLGRMD